jgi:eukaryotic-like serine/threonine-protein kinase
MSIVPGTRVGAYDVVARIGAGGMGEVFRGRDARLRRDVALKVLPAAAMADPDRRRRFEREAQVLAALDHPNIAHVFGIEDAAGSPVIVMELVEGPTLAERLASRSMPVEEAIGAAIELCRGLEAAHDCGVIHRDLKPANIKLRSDGVVKILDFGLALAPAEDEADAANSPTTLAMRTEVGTVLGTAAYMSPEQARGRQVDVRADLWAFGCVLYEMLTARAAFAGETTADILAAVVHKDPDWAALPASLPARVDELLRRCLQKTVKDRQRDAGEARYQLEQALKDLSGAGPRGNLPALSPAAGVRGTRAWGPPALGVLGGAALTALWLTSDGKPAPRTPALVPVVRAAVTLPAGATLALGRGSAVAISPDGTRLVFAARVGDRTLLYRRDLNRYESEALAGTEGATNPFFSPDGRWVGFFADRKLKKVAIDGGAPVNVADAPNPRGEAWGDDDVILVTPTNADGLFRVSASGGSLEPFTALRAGERAHRWPRFVPGGSAVVFSLWNDTGWEPASIHAQRLDGSERVVVVERNGGYPRYLRDAGTRGYLVYAREEGLMAAPFDASTLALTGTAVPMFDGLITNLSGGAHFDVSSGGTLAYVPGALTEANRELQWVALDGTASAPIAVENFSSREWRLSPDGRRVIYSTTTGGPTRDLWLKDLATGAATRLTQGVDSAAAKWSRDGSWIAYLKGSPWQLVRREARPGATDQVLLANPDFGPGDISPDGRWIIYSRSGAGGPPDIFVRPLGTPPAGAGDARAIAATPAVESDAMFSPDGRSVVYQSNTTGRFEVYVKAFPEGEQEHRISTDGGFSPAWASSGRAIYFRAPSNAMMAVDVSTGDGGVTVGRPRQLFDASRFDLPYAVAPDGRRLLMMPALASESAATEIRLVLNFLDELRQRVK